MTRDGRRPADRAAEPRPEDDDGPRRLPRFVDDLDRSRLDDVERDLYVIASQPDGFPVSEFDDAAALDLIETRSGRSTATRL
jgi:hypothetical protein